MGNEDKVLAAVAAGLDGHALIAWALLDVADAIREGLGTEYAGPRNALELIAGTLGADGSGKGLAGEVANVASALGDLQGVGERIACSVA